jgi:hypothetical protein
MVARACGNDSPALLLTSEMGNLVVGSPEFEAVNTLQIFPFQVHRTGFLLA